MFWLMAASAPLMNEPPHNCEDVILTGRFQSCWTLPTTAEWITDVLALNWKHWFVLNWRGIVLIFHQRKTPKRLFAKLNVSDVKRCFRSTFCFDVLGGEREIFIQNYCLIQSKFTNHFWAPKNAFFSADYICWGEKFTQLYSQFALKLVGTKEVHSALLKIRLRIIINGPSDGEKCKWLPFWAWMEPFW